jgi:hypothetical protein
MIEFKKTIIGEKEHYVLLRNNKLVDYFPKYSDTTRNTILPIIPKELDDVDQRYYYHLVIGNTGIGLFRVDDKKWLVVRGNDILGEFELSISDVSLLDYIVLTNTFYNDDTVAFTINIGKNRKQIIVVGYFRDRSYLYIDNYKVGKDSSIITMKIPHILAKLKVYNGDNKFTIEYNNDNIINRLLDGTLVNMDILRYSLSNGYICLYDKDNIPHFIYSKEDRLFCFKVVNNEIENVDIDNVVRNVYDFSRIIEIYPEYREYKRHISGGNYIDDVLQLVKPKESPLLAIYPTPAILDKDTHDSNEHIVFNNLHTTIFSTDITNARNNSMTNVDNLIVVKDEQSGSIGLLCRDKILGLDVETYSDTKNMIIYKNTSISKIAAIHAICRIGNKVYFMYDSPDLYYYDIKDKVCKDVDTMELCKLIGDDTVDMDALEKFSRIF